LARIGASAGAWTLASEERERACFRSGAQTPRIACRTASAALPRMPAAALLLATRGAAWAVAMDGIGT